MADDFAPGVQTPGDIIIGESTRRIEDHFGAENLIIRQRILDRSALELGPFLSRKIDFEWAGSRHMASMPE